MSLNEVSPKFSSTAGTILLKIYEFRSYLPCSFMAQNLSEDMGALLISEPHVLILVTVLLKSHDTTGGRIRHLLTEYKA